MQHDISAKHEFETKELIFFRTSFLDFSEISYQHLFILLIKYILPFASTYLIDIIGLFRFIKFEK